MQSNAIPGNKSSWKTWLACLFCVILQACGGSAGAPSGAVSASDNSAWSLSQGQQGLFLIAGGIGGPGTLDGVGAHARLNHPEGVALSQQSNLYIADASNYTIRKITSLGEVSTIAGKSGTAGNADGSASSALFRAPRYVAVDAQENLYLTDGNAVRRISAAGIVTTLAGATDIAGSADGAGAAARFDNPAGIAIDAGGNLYVADQNNNVIRKIALDNTVTTLAGTAGAAGSSDGVGMAARFNHPQGISLAADGMLYVADRDNYIIRRVSPSGEVTTVAGSPGINGSADGTGMAAQFFAPQSIAADSAGNLYVADAFLFDRMCLCGANGLIRKIAPNGEVTTLAGTSKVYGSADGTGPAARFNLPLGIASSSSGELYVADTFNNTIRKISPAGAVSTFAGLARTSGYADGNAMAALFNDPLGLAADSSGNLYVSDTSNLTDASNALIRKVAAQGTVSTFAGMPGVTGTGFADGAASMARFTYPRGVVLDLAGNLYIADTGNSVIRKISANGMVSTLAGVAHMAGSNDGPGSVARFNQPSAIAIDRSGNLYVSDILHDLAGNDSAAIRKITPDGMVTTLAGVIGLPGDDDGAGANARFTNPLGIGVDAQGNVYVTDATRHTVRKITPGGLVSTIAGAAGVSGHADGVGNAARFHQPQGIAVDSMGVLYVADTLNNSIRKITAVGDVVTVVGQPERSGIETGTLAAASLYQPVGIAFVRDGLFAVTALDGILGLALP